MSRTMNQVFLAGAVLFCAACAMSYPMLLGEPDIQDGSDSSDGSFEQQMQQSTMAMVQPIPSAPVMSSEQPVNVVQMQQEGNAMAQGIPTEPSSELQAAQQQQLAETMEPPKAETVPLEPSTNVQPSQSDMTMLSDQPSVTDAESSQILEAAQAQATPMCPIALANDCPEKEMETPSSPVVQSPPANGTELSQAEHIVVMQPDDQKTDKFEIASTAA